MASPAGQPVLRFGAFELDASSGELRKDGISLKLHPQPLRVLVLLAGRPGEIVTRGEIQRCLWGNHTFVDFDRGINFCISQIRAVLADDAANPRYIETVPRRGYRFKATNELFLAPKSSCFTTPASALTPEPTLEPRSAEAARSSELASKSEIYVVLPLIEPRQEHSIRKIPLAVVAIVLVATVVVATWAVFHFREPPKLTEKDTVLLADFDNTTGDPVFDETLKQALTVGLSQSPFLNLMHDKKIAETLRMMGRSSLDRITPEVAQEICVRTGGKAFLAGKISMLGSVYVLDVNAVACNSGTLLALSRANAHSKEDVLNALSRMAAALRSKLGESLPSVEKYDVPIQATTTSLEALQSMSMAARVGAAENDEASIPFVQRALDYDPTFALAYAGLARRYQNLDQPQLALENASKAYRLRGSVSEREQFEISSIYFRATGDLENLTKTVELWKATYPQDGGPHGRLCVNYQFLGQFEKALQECQEALQLDPANGVNFDNLVAIYLNLNRYDDAQRVCESAMSRNLHCSWPYFLDFVRGDAAGMAVELSSAMGKPGAENALLAAQADTHCYYGQLRLAREFSRRASDSALRSGFRETASLWLAKTALCEAEAGENSAATRAIGDALQLSSGRITKVLAAMVAARVGDGSQARRLIKQLQQSDPDNTLLKIYWFPLISAAVELKQGNLSKTFSFLRATAPLDLALPSPNEVGTLYPVYLRGNAYLSARNGTAAATEFETVLNHPGITLNFVNGALARLGLARAYVLKGDSAKAHTAYEDFLRLWENADSDISILKQAKVEYAKLQ
jgi:eukaryotic-like serine/threonine-protein kinase